MLTLKVEDFADLIITHQDLGESDRGVGWDMKFSEKLRHIECISLKFFLKSAIRQADTLIESISAEKVCNKKCHY